MEKGDSKKCAFCSGFYSKNGSCDCQSVLKKDDKLFRPENFGEALAQIITDSITEHEIANNNKIQGDMDKVMRLMADIINKRMPERDQ